MAAENKDYKDVEMIFPILDKELFEKHNNDVKDLIETFKEYEDGWESINGFGLRVYESYDEYLKEQNALKEAWLSKQRPPAPEKPEEEGITI